MIQYWKEAVPDTLTATATVVGLSSAANPDTGVAASASPASSSSASTSSSPKSRLTFDSSVNSNMLGNSRSSSSPSLPFTRSQMSEEEVSASVTSHVLQNKLSPGTWYGLRMLGQNQFGPGFPSDPVHFLTKSEPPSLPPVDISCESMGSSVIVIKWKPPPRDHWNGQLKGYRIGYRVLTPLSSSPTMGKKSSSSLSGSQASSSFEDTHQSTRSNLMSADQKWRVEGEGGAIIEKMYTMKEVAFSAIPSEEQQLILTGLDKATTYGLIVCAFNDAGSGPFSHQVIVSTSPNGQFNVLRVLHGCVLLSLS